MNITTDRVWVGDTTITTTGTSTSISGRYPPKVEQGWKCPRCGRINAPWKSQCDCSNWTYKPEWWCNSDTFRIHPDSTIYISNIKEIY